MTRPWLSMFDMPIGDHRNIVREVRDDSGRKTALAYWTGDIWAFAPISDRPIAIDFKVAAQREPAQASVHPMKPGAAFSLRGNNAVSLVITGEDMRELLTILPDGSVQCDDVLRAGDAGELFVESVRHFVTARTKGLVEELAELLGRARAIAQDDRDGYLETSALHLLDDESGECVPLLESLGEDQQLFLAGRDMLLEQIDAALAKVEANR